jgi:hypothetical protein
MIERDMNGDFAELMLKWRAAIELIQRPPDFDESFLREVFEFVRVAFIAVENRQDERLMPPDEFRELIRRAAANSLQQFGIVVHRAIRRRSLREPSADAGDDSIHEIVQSRLHLAQLLTLIAGQKGVDFAKELEAFNCQVGFNGGHLGRRGAHGSFGGVGRLNRRAQARARVVQPHEQTREIVLVGLERSSDLRDLIGGQTEFFLRALQQTAAERTLRRRRICGTRGKGE